MGDNLTDAIKHFKSLQKRYTTQNNERQCDFVKTAIEALEKQLIKSGNGLNETEEE